MKSSFTLLRRRNIQYYSLQDTQLNSKKVNVVNVSSCTLIQPVKPQAELMQHVVIVYVSQYPITININIADHISQE